MPARLEDYGLIGDCHTAALVSREGSIDWLCLPRFDSGACFAALLGAPEHGRWVIQPAGEFRVTGRRYRDDTLILETDFETDSGAVTMIDCMPPRTQQPDLVRMVVGRRGQVAMHLELVMRFDYGSIVPWVRRFEGGIQAVAGPDTLVLRTPVKVVGQNFTSVADFSVSADERVPFVLTWHASHLAEPAAIDPEDAIARTEQIWREWSGRCNLQGPWREAALRSLITLKALTYWPTGGIVAAATTSLPEHIGGVRNWDYRFCWLRDATFTLYALMLSGYDREANLWRQWLLRAVAGDPSKIQIMYGLAGERRLTEWDVPWLPGYEDSRPVRIGNAAHQQLQLDVYGELMDSMHQCRRSGLCIDTDAWQLETALVETLEKIWTEPDEGIWEVRGPRQQFTHSKMMSWVAMDRAVKGIERFKLPGPLERWRAIRDTIHAEVCEKGFSSEKGAFVQHYGSLQLDASLLMMPLVGFLPADDPRVRGTVAAIQRELTHDGFVARYSTQHADDGLPPGEGVFLACTFWLADNLALQGHMDEAREVFERLLAIRNEVGLLSEEYDVKGGRLVGNFPQAFSHVGLINTASNLSRRQGAAEHRQQT